MKIYILLGHDDTKSFNGKLADAYEQSACAKGHEVRRQNIGELHFDPILRKGVNDTVFEPDIIAAQDNIKWCEHWVLFYPVWWGSVPALLKGFIDRTIASGFGYKYHRDDPFWDKLLTGRSAHIIATSDGPWWWLYFQYRDSDVNTVKRATLEFCGIKPVKVTRISLVRKMTPEQKEKAIQSMDGLL